MKSYLREIYEDAVTDQDIYTNFSSLFSRRLEDEMMSGDSGALCDEIADLIINNDSESKL